MIYSGIMIACHNIEINIKDSKIPLLSSYINEMNDIKKEAKELHRKFSN